MEPVGPGEGGEVGVVGGDGTALGRGEVLGGVEAEAHGVGTGPTHRAPVVGGAQGVGGVFDQRHAGVGAEAVDLGGHRHPSEVDGDDGVEALVEGRGEREAGEVEGGGVHVEQHRREVVVHGGQCGGDEGPRRDPDARPRREAEVGQADLQRRGARRHRDHVGGAQVAGQVGFQPRALRAGGEPTAAQDPGDGGDVVVGDLGRGEQDGVGAGGGAACRELARTGPSVARHPALPSRPRAYRQGWFARNGSVWLEAPSVAVFSPPAPPV